MTSLGSVWTSPWTTGSPADTLPEYSSRSPSFADCGAPFAQGPEFTSRALDHWAYGKGVDLKLIAAGKPTQNAYIESFNGKFRDECLKRSLLHDPRTCTRRHQRMAARLQRGKASQLTWTHTTA